MSSRQDQCKLNFLTFSLILNLFLVGWIVTLNESEAKLLLLSSALALVHQKEIPAVSSTFLCEKKRENGKQGMRESNPGPLKYQFRPRQIYHR